MVLAEPSVELLAEALVVGLGLAISGATVLATALARDPATDFSDMGVCKIYSTSVTRKTESSTRTENGRQRTEYTCNDEYVYTFCLPTNLQFCSWKSKTDTKQVCGRRCEECTNTDTTPTFEAGEDTQCWEPAPEYTPGFPYVCGNTPCYKIFDPAGEATAWIVLGAVLLAIGVVISVAFLVTGPELLRGVQHLLWLCKRLAGYMEAPGGDIEGTELEKAASCVFELGPPPSPPSQGS